MPGEMSIELSLDQVLEVARKMGFIIEVRDAFHHLSSVILMH
jgi:hypothetical protein